LRLSNAVVAKAACPNAHIVVDVSASGCGDPEATEVALELKAARNRMPRSLERAQRLF
jgi:hypothetical protein